MSFTIFLGNCDFKALLHSLSKLSLKSDCLSFNLLRRMASLYMTITMKTMELAIQFMVMSDLTSYQKVIIYTTHIKKAIVKLYFIYSEKENNQQTIIGQKFRRRQKFPSGFKNFVTGTESESQKVTPATASDHLCSLRGSLHSTAPTNHIGPVEMPTRLGERAPHVS